MMLGIGLSITIPQGGLFAPPGFAFIYARNQSTGLLEPVTAKNKQTGIYEPVAVRIAA